MSATLTWFSSQGAKTGTTSASIIADINTMVAANDGNGNFSWRVASVNTATSPYYVVFKPKSGGPGRILCVLFTATPGAHNATIFFSVPSNNALYMTYFPNGNTDVPLNLTAASGTILGNDTGAMAVGGASQVTTLYGASILPMYFDSAEALVLGFQNPGVVALFWMGAGNLVVDAADVAYPACLHPINSSAMSLGNAGIFSWTAVATILPPNSTTPSIIANYRTINEVFFQAYVTSGPYAAQAPGSQYDILADTSVSKAWFVPIPLVGQAVKGGGFPLKLRQMAIGPPTNGPFATYSESGPVLRARQFCAGLGGGGGYPWFTNFKV